MYNNNETNPTNITGAFATFPFVNRSNVSSYGSESYPVYVNGDFIGSRLSVTQGDGGKTAVDSFLKSRKLNNYRVAYNGNDIHIESRSSENAEKIKHNLNVYLNIR